MLNLLLCDYYNMQEGKHRLDKNDLSSPTCYLLLTTPRWCYCRGLLYCSLVFRTDRSGQTVQTQIRLLLIRVYTVCCFVYIFWTHFSMVKPRCSNFRMITTILSMSEFFGFLRYHHCHCLLVLDFLFALFRTVWWPSAGKQLSSWLSASVVSNYPVL